MKYLALIIFVGFVVLASSFPTKNLHKGVARKPKYNPRRFNGFRDFMEYEGRYLEALSKSRRPKAHKRCLGMPMAASYGYGFPGFGWGGGPYGFPGCDVMPGDYIGWGTGWGGPGGYGLYGFPGGWGGCGGFGCGCPRGCGGGCGCASCGGNCCGGFSVPHWCLCPKEEGEESGSGASGAGGEPGMEKKEGGEGEKGKAPPPAPAPAPAEAPAPAAPPPDAPTR